MKKILICTLTLLVVFSLAFVGVACGQGTATTTSAAETTAAAAETTAAAAETTAAAAETTAAAATGQYIWKRDVGTLEKSLTWSPSDVKAKVALVTSGMTHPYWVHQWAMLQKTRDKYFPNIELKLYDAQLDAMKMIGNIKAAIADKSDVIILDNHLGEAAYPGYQAANDANVPLVFYSTGAPVDVYGMPLGNFKYVTVVRGDEVSEAEKITDFVVTKINGKGNIVIIQGVPESSNNLNRRVGIQNVLDYWPDVKVIAEGVANWGTDLAYKFMRDTLAAHPDANSINALISINDSMVLGASRAITELNRRSEMVIASFDAAQPGLDLLKSGDIDASARYDSTLEGVLILDSVVKAIKGESVPIIRRTPTQLLTQQNYKIITDDPTANVWEKTPTQELPWSYIESYMVK
ncbi:MAG: sugar ABC transporter substrate-binding protein [Candidatus Humimicrobiaceae bacterium]